VEREVVFVQTKTEVELEEGEVKENKVLRELCSFCAPVAVAGATDQAFSSFVVEGEQGHPLAHQHFSSNLLSLSLATAQPSRTPLTKDGPAELADVSALLPMKLKCLGRSEAPETPQQIIRGQKSSPSSASI